MDRSIPAVAELETLFGRLWTQCQECQGSLHQDVLCTRYFDIINIVYYVIFCFLQWSLLENTIQNVSFSFFFFILSAHFSSFLPCMILHIKMQCLVPVGTVQYFIGGRRHRRTWQKLNCNQTAGVSELFLRWCVVLFPQINLLNSVQWWLPQSHITESLV